MKSVSVWIPFVLCSFLLGACASTKGGLKARPEKPSAFLNQPGLHPDPARVPFDLVWRAPGFREETGAYSHIYIAPVHTEFLRPMNRPAMQAVAEPILKDRPVQETANIMRTEFIRAFQHSPSPRLTVVNRPGPNTLTLELALVELNPTNVAGNLVRYGAPGGYTLTPLTKGNISIEGKLRDSQTGKVLYEFADNEQDRFSVVSLRDLTAYGHARAAIHDWAKQFEELTRTPASHKVADTAAITVNPF